MYVLLAMHFDIFAKTYIIWVKPTCFLSHHQLIHGELFFTIVLMTNNLSNTKQLLYIDHNITGLKGSLNTPDDTEKK